MIFRRTQLIAWGLCILMAGAPTAWTQDVPPVIQRVEKMVVLNAGDAVEVGDAICDQGFDRQLCNRL